MYSVLGDKDAAQATWEEVLRIDPGNQAALDALRLKDGTDSK